MMPVPKTYSRFIVNEWFVKFIVSVVINAFLDAIYNKINKLPMISVINEMSSTSFIHVVCFIMKLERLSDMDEILQKISSTKTQFGDLVSKLA
jgi:hypothetical protein